MLLFFFCLAVFGLFFAPACCLVLAGSFVCNVVASQVLLTLVLLY
jgi:hypothetical protein